MEDLPADKPMKYLVDVEKYLNDNGGLKDEAGLKDFLVFMKKASKMAPRVLLLLIIKATEKKLQAKFCLSEGWNVLTGWLREAKEEINDSFIREILTVMIKLPVSVNVLKSNSCAKAVKQLAKINPEVSPEVPKLAREVVIKWMSIINDSFDTKPKEKEKIHSKKPRNESLTTEEPPLKKRKKDKEKKRHDSSESEFTHGRKEKRGSVDNLKEHSSSINLKHSEKSQDRHSDKHRSEKHEKHNHDDKSSEKYTSRKREREESPDTKQRKRATVKILPQRMRTAGIEEGGEKTVVTKSRSEVLAAKKEKLEKAAPESGTAPSIESMHQKIKVSVSGSNDEHVEPRSTANATSPNNNAKLRRPSHEIHESNSFMNALNAASGPPVVRKKKKVGNATSPLSKTKPDTVNNAKTDVKQVAIEKDKSHTDEGAHSDDSNDSQGPKKSSMAEIGSLITKKTSKKSVSWADEENLREIYYFELDETERINVNRVTSIEEMKRKEHLLERQNISRTLSTGSHPPGSAPEANPSSPYEKGWYRPMGLEGASCTTEFGKNSREVAIQSERERHVLAALYFSKEDIPPSAKEPDTAHEDYVEPVIIPLEDQTIMEPDAITDKSSGLDEEKHPDKVGTASPNESSGALSSPKSPNSGTAQSSKVLIAENETFSLTPEVASLLKSITANLTDTKQVESKGTENVTNKPTETSKSAGLLPIPKQGMQPKPQQPKYSDDVWRVLRENYPHLNLDESISVERMRQLLEPIQEQLRACGALNTKSSPPPFQRPNTFSNGPNRPGNHPGQMARPMNPGSYGPGSNGPPPGPNSHPRPHHPRPIRPNMSHPQQRPHYPNYNNPGPRGFPQPPHISSHRPPFGGGGPPPFGGPNGNGGGPPQGYRTNNICRFYQNGSCRSGPHCRFVHPQSGGPPHSPQDI